MKTEVRRGRKFVEYIDDSLPAGTFVQEIGAHDVSYQDDNSVWQPIDESWETDGQDGFSFRAQRMNHKVRFDSIGAWRWYPRRNVETEYIVINRPKCWLTRTNRWGNLLVNGISREGRDITLTSLRNVTRVIHSRWNGIKTDWILENADAPTRFQQQIDLVGLTEVDGWLYGADGEQVARLTPTAAIDAEGNELPTSTSYQNGILEFQADVTGAVYPVTIDPDFASGASFGMVRGEGTNDTYSTARSTSVLYNNSDYYYFVVGQYYSGDDDWLYTARLFIKFDTSSIPDTDTVSQVNLRMVAIGSLPETNFDVQIVKYDWSSQDPLSDVNREAAFDGCLAATADDNIWRNTSGMSLNTQYTSGNLSTAWVNKTGITYYGLRSSRDVSATQPYDDESLLLAWPIYETTSYRPVLIVTYGSASQNLTLTCAAGSYTLTGAAATLEVRRNYVLSCNAGSYSLTGANATLEVRRNYTLSCNAGSYTLTGANADLTVRRNYTLSCNAGSYALTGTNADLTVTRHYTLSCEGGSYSLTGTNADITSSRTLVCDSASGGAYPDITVSGAGTSAVNGTYAYLALWFGKPLYKLGDNSIWWDDSKWAIINAFESGNRYESTEDVATPDLVTTWTVGVDGTLPVPTVTIATTYTLTGSDVTLTYTQGAQSYTLTCEAGSYALTGTIVDLTVQRNYALDCSAGNYLITGTDVTLSAQFHYTLSLEAGSYSLTGTNAGLTSARTMACNAGSYTLTGTNAGFYRAFVMACNAGSYALTGSDATFNANYVFALGMGSYVLVGTSVGLFILTPTPACRTATIEFENRTFAIPHEDRTATIEFENRTLEVTCH